MRPDGAFGDHPRATSHSYSARHKQEASGAGLAQYASGNRENCVHLNKRGISERFSLSSEENLPNLGLWFFTLVVHVKL